MNFVIICILMSSPLKYFLIFIMFRPDHRYEAV
jgi:hypothetical protein